jgi:ammonium transporter, Amt family
MNLLRVPHEVELAGLDFANNEAYDAAVADVIAAERAMVK